jgi:hypothetical protein
MELLNATDMIAGYAMGLDREGRESLVVVVKGTFALPHHGGEALLTPRQEPLVAADVHTGEPGISAPLYESDYAPEKRRCDVILHGNAHAPGGRAAQQVQVALRVGSVNKTINVVGNRSWYKVLGKVEPSAPKPFVTMPLSYNTAFGGVDRSHDDPARHVAFLRNPVGVGFVATADARIIDGKPLPVTEKIGEAITAPDGNYTPVSFGPVGRGWEPRFRFAGTYDQQWQDNVFPFLPADFDPAYFQCAPADQQTEYLRGGETVELVNLTPQGRLSFRIPHQEVPVVFFRKKGERHECRAVADTLILEPEQGRFMITWRASLLLKKNLFEVPQVLVGNMPAAWWRAREQGKSYYRSLGELARSRGRGAGEDAE